MINGFTLQFSGLFELSFRPFNSLIKDYIILELLANSGIGYIIAPQFFIINN